MSEEAEPRRRADARRNRERVLAAAAEVVAEQGAQASLRDVARRAEVGLGTLYRHFPTRDALLAELLGARFAALVEQAEGLAAAELTPAAALREWLRAFVFGVSTYRDLPAALVDTLADEQSALHKTCAQLRGSAQVLLERAQAAGAVRADVDGADLFALAAAVGWITEQSGALAERREHLFGVLYRGLETG